MSKWLIVYSSVTGNTKQIAEVMYTEFGEDKADICSIKEIEKFPIDNYDNIAIGYWLTRGGPDKEVQKLLTQVQNKMVILFQTHGAFVGSEHAVTAFARAGSYLSKDNYILGTFSCQGKLNPAILERRRNNDAENPHSATSKNMKRWEEAAKHPNEDDFLRVKEFVAAMKHKLELRKNYFNTNIKN